MAEAELAKERGRRWCRRGRGSESFQGSDAYGRSLDFILSMKSHCQFLSRGVMDIITFPV